MVGGHGSTLETSSICMSVYGVGKGCVLAGGESGAWQYFRNFIYLYINIGGRVLILGLYLQQVGKAGHGSVSKTSYIYISI